MFVRRQRRHRETTRGLDEREENSFALNNNDDNNNWIEYLEDIGCKEKIMEIQRCIADTR